MLYILFAALSKLAKIGFLKVHLKVVKSSRRRQKIGFKKKKFDNFNEAAKLRNASDDASI